LKSEGIKLSSNNVFRVALFSQLTIWSRSWCSNISEICHCLREYTTLLHYKDNLVNGV